MLKLYDDDPEHKRKVPQDEDEGERYVIHRIIDHRLRKDGQKEYLIQWKGYDEDENTWEPAEVVEKDAPGSIEDYQDMLAEVKAYVMMDMD